MIVAETAAGYRFITQPDHGRMVGTFADHWGNGAFEVPDQSPSVAVAAHVHDDGWWQRDRRPSVRDDGTPERFTGIPSEVGQCDRQGTALGDGRRAAVGTVDDLGEYVG